MLCELPDPLLPREGDAESATKSPLGLALRGLNGKLLWLDKRCFLTQVLPLEAADDVNSNSRQSSNTQVVNDRVHKLRLLPPLMSRTNSVRTTAPTMATKIV